MGDQVVIMVIGMGTRGYIQWVNVKHKCYWFIKLIGDPRWISRGADEVILCVEFRVLGCFIKCHVWEWLDFSFVSYTSILSGTIREEELRRTRGFSWNNARDIVQQMTISVFGVSLKYFKIFFTLSTKNVYMHGIGRIQNKRRRR